MRVSLRQPPPSTYASANHWPRGGGVRPQPARPPCPRAARVRRGSRPAPGTVVARPDAAIV